MEHYPFRDGTGAPANIIISRLQRVRKPSNFLPFFCRARLSQHFCEELDKLACRTLSCAVVNQGGAGSVAKGICIFYISLASRILPRSSTSPRNPNLPQNMGTYSGRLLLLGHSDTRDSNILPTTSEIAFELLKTSRSKVKALS